MKFLMIDQEEMKFIYLNIKYINEISYHEPSEYINIYTNEKTISGLVCAKSFSKISHF